MAVITYAGTYTSMAQPTQLTQKVPGYPWTKDEVSIRFMESDCKITTFTAQTASLAVTCQLPHVNNEVKVKVAGTHEP